MTMKNKYTRIYYFVIALLGTLVLPYNGIGQCTFTNPVMEGADPHVTYYDGNYYMLVTRGDRVGIKVASELQRIHEYNEIIAWRFLNTPVGGHVWAPELHRVDGKWYIYTCGQNTGLAANPVSVDYIQENQQMVLLESQSDSPLGPYEFKTWLLEGTGAIDETVFTHTDGKNYIIWSQFNAPGQPQTQCLYIAELLNAWTIGEKRVQISCPEENWERNGWPVNEGATVLQRNGNTFVVYSGSGYLTPEYALGYLLNTDGDLLNPESWTKTGPVFQQNPDGGVYSTGHNSFTRSPDGSEYWNVYHGRLSPNGNTSRYVFLQKFFWKGDVPDFGTPIPAYQEIPCPSSNRGQVITIQPADTGKVVLTDPSGTGPAILWDVDPDSSLLFNHGARLMLVPGMADPAAVSYESVTNRGHYLYSNGGLVTGPYDGSESFRKSATFLERDPWDDTVPGALSIESYLQPGYFVSAGNPITLSNVSAQSTTQEKEDATWRYTFPGEIFDCNGDFRGEAFIDSCGVCAGGNTGIEPSLDKYECPSTFAAPEKSSVLLLYPNPAKNFIIIDIPGATGVYTVFVYDYAGRMKINAELTRNELTISGLDDGLYYLKIRAQNSIYSGTFLKI